MNYSYRAAVVITALMVFGASAQAGTVIVPYTGSYDEALVPAEDGLPAGDYDTIGGLADVGQFNLVGGLNTFDGSVWTPGDSGDGFLIGIGANQTLTGASIAFGTNLSPFAPMFAFPPPNWGLYESSAIPTIFEIPVGFDYASSVQNITAPAFIREAGVYNVFIGNGTFGINAGNYDTPIDYTMTFTVEEHPVPIPAALPLCSSGLAVMGFLGWRRKRKDSAA